MTPTSAPGSKSIPAGAGTGRRQGRSSRADGVLARGFTVIELMVVITLIAVSVGVVSLSIRDQAASRLEEEGARLSALLEAARARSRVAGTPVMWRPAGTDGHDFAFVGLPPGDPLPDRWLDERVTAEVIGAPALLLGPEPVIGAQQVILRLDDRQLVLATDGLDAFDVRTDGGGK